MRPGCGTIEAGPEVPHEAGGSLVSRPRDCSGARRSIAQHFNAYARSRPRTLGIEPAPDSRRAEAGSVIRRVPAERATALLAARSREDSVATEILLTNAKQVSDDAASAAR
jgi:hypothetical protein